MLKYSVQHQCRHTTVILFILCVSYRHYIWPHWVRHKSSECLPILVCSVAGGYVTTTHKSYTCSGKVASIFLSAIGFVWAISLLYFMWWHPLALGTRPSSQTVSTEKEATAVTPKMCLKFYINHSSCAEFMPETYNHHKIRMYNQVLDS